MQRSLEGRFSGLIDPRERSILQSAFAPHRLAVFVFVVFAPVLLRGWAARHSRCFRV